VRAKLNLDRYLRLMALASADLLLTTPLGIWVLYSNVAVFGLSPWISWDDTHSNFSRVVQVPGIYSRADPYSAARVETLRWATVVCALLFFAYIGFADEVIKNYRGKAYGRHDRGVVGAQFDWVRPLFSSFAYPFYSATSKFPLSSSSSGGASATLRIHPERHHPHAGFVRLLLGYVRVVWGDLTVGVRG
jgi:hypothetical protein